MRRLGLTAWCEGRTAARLAGMMMAAALLGSAVVPVATAPAGTAGEMSAPAARARATDDRTIAHVLNRIAFGPAPGDIARVREMGLDRYIDQQLHPERLPDTALQARLVRFETLQLASNEIGERFYQLQERQRILQQARAKMDDGMSTKPAGQPGDMSMPAPTAAPPTTTPGTTGQPGATPPKSDGSDQMMMGRPTTGVAPASGQPAAQQPAQQPPNRTERDELLASLSPEDRRRLMELRQQNQQVLNELAEQKLVRAVYSERQLEEVLVDFWFNHFNVFAGKGPTRIYLTEYERDTIRPRVFGKFRDLLGATAQSPAMLFYLDNWQSSDPDAAAKVPRRRMPGDPAPGDRTLLPQRPRRMPDGTVRRPRPGQFPRANDGMAADGMTGMTDAERRQRLQALAQRQRRGLNENYARELMELHTLGVDGGGYTQRDIVDVAKCFTGWTIQEPRRGGGFRFDDRRHTQGPKTVLGHKIDKGGIKDGEAVLDLLASHKSTATFIATKLARRFVSDTPPKALVERAAAKFRATDGDLREVVRTILTSPEFLSAEAMRAKVKTPFEFVASALRATGAEIEDGTVLVRNLQGMGMPLYMAQPPTGYLDRADVWVNTGALLNRMNFAVALVNNRLRGVRLDLATLAGSANLPPAGAAAGAATGVAPGVPGTASGNGNATAGGASSAPGGATAVDLTAVRNALLATLLSNEVSDTTRATIAKGSEVTQVAALTLGSPEFQRR